MLKKNLSVKNKNEEKGFSSRSNYLPGELISEFGLKEVEFLRRDSLTIHYRSVNDNGEIIHLRTLLPERISAKIGDRLNFKSEAATINSLNLPEIVSQKVIEKENSFYLISSEMPDLYLNDWLKTNEPKIDISLALITNIAKILDKVHNENIVHGGLSPANILLFKNNRGYKVKLSDFGLNQIKNLRSMMDDLGEVTETFAYLSPEQIKLGKGLQVNIDERSDLYALGIIFYQLLTGRLPFVDNNVSSLFQKHLNANPALPSHTNHVIPEVLDQIILKLLAKDPDARYQTAAGLLSDLTRLRNGERNFEPGLNDKFVRLDYRTSLVGRAAELNTLRQAFIDTLSGSGSLVNISGVAGSGKTRLALEAKNFIKEQDKIFTGGKFFAGTDKEPYAPFKEALDKYLERYAGYTEEVQQKIKKYIGEKIGISGSILLGFDPALSSLIGSEHSPAPALDSRDKEDERFRNILAQFFIDLAAIENGLVIMLDDLQWADRGSIDLLKELAYKLKDSQLMIINTYRFEEVTAEHPFAIFNKFSRENNLPLKEIHLELFDDQRMIEFSSGILHETSPVTRQIAEFVQNKTSGNPFFALEIIRQLVEKKVLQFDSQSKLWKIAQSLQTVEMPEDIIKALVKRLDDLNPVEQQVISLAAVIGRKFDVEIIFDILEREGIGQEEIIRALNNAITINLLDKDTENDVQGKTYLFVHDRIKEAAFQRIAPEAKKLYHLYVAFTLEKKYADQLDDFLFELVYHFRNGGDLNKTLEYAYPAGIKAKDKFANETAIENFQFVLEILNNYLQNNNLNTSEISIHQTKINECYENLGEVYLTIGENEKAIDIFENKLLPITKNSYEQAKIYQKISQVSFRSGDHVKSILYGEKGLSILKQFSPKTDNAALPGIIWEFFLHTLYKFFPSIFTKKAENTNEISNIYKLVIWINYSLAWSYAKNNEKKLVRSILKIVNLGERNIGPSNELAMAYSAFGNITMSANLTNNSFKIANKYYEKSLFIKELLKDLWGKGQTYQFLGYCNNWAGFFEDSNKFLNEALNIFKKIGDQRETAAVYAGLSHNFYCLSNYTLSLQNNKKYFNISNKTKDIEAIAISYLNNMCIYYESGNKEEAISWGLKALEFIDKAFNKESLRFTYLTACMEIGRIYLELYSFNNLDIKYFNEALRYLDIAKSGLLTKNSFLKNYYFNIFNYSAELELIKYTLNKSKLSNIKSCAHKAIKENKKWPTHYGGALRVAAKYYALVGKSKKAEKYFIQSIEHCHKIGRRYEEGKSLYEYGLFLKSISTRERSGETITNKTLEARSRAELEKAYKLFEEIGANLYLQRTAQALGSSIDAEETSGMKGVILTNKYRALLKSISNTAAAENLDIYLQNTLETAIEQVQAKRGSLFLFNKFTGKLEPRAAFDLNPKDIPLPLLEKVFSELQYHKYDEAGTDKNFLQYIKDLHLTADEKRELKSVLVMPVINSRGAKDEAVGVLYLDNHSSKAVFADSDIQDTLEPLIKLAGIEIEKNRQAAELKKSLPPHLIKQVQDGGSLELGGTSKDVTIMMSDIRNFTTISNKLGADLTFELLNAYYSWIEDTVSRYNGWIDKYIGDCPMIIFNNTADALRAAIQMRFDLREFNELLNGFAKDHGIEPLELGFGLAKGMSMVGNIGSFSRLEPTVIGDKVNLSERLESLNKVYYTQILIEENIYNYLKENDLLGEFFVRHIGRVKPKGSLVPVNIYEVYNSSKKDIRKLKLAYQEKFSKALNIYLKPANQYASVEQMASAWQEALEIFTEINDAFLKVLPKEKWLREKETKKPIGDNVSYVMIRRLMEMIATRENYLNWDGTYTHETK